MRWKYENLLVYVAPLVVLALVLLVDWLAS
jgi:hypothetical protein